MFQGLSLLRKDEKKKEELTEAQKKHQEYLKKYGGSSNDGEPKKKKKKKTGAKAAQPAAVRIFDDDVSGFKAMEAVDDEDEDLQPVIANPEEAKVFERQLQETKNYFNTKEDGRGWVALSAVDDEEPRQRRARHDSPDLDLPRRPSKDAGGSVADMEPPRKRRHDSDDDLDVPRRSARDAAEDMEPPRRRRHGSDDEADVRRPAAAAPGDLEPPRRRRQDSPDMDVPRRPSTSHAREVADLEPPRRQRHDSPDTEAPRRLPAPGGRDDGDLAPPRRRRQDSPEPQPGRPAGPTGRDTGDLEPPRKRRHDSPDADGPGVREGGDLEPPRKRRQESPDLEPARRAGAPGPAAGASGRTATQMNDGTGTGLVTAAEMAREAARLKVEADQRKRTAVGKGAETVYRDRVSGKVQTAEEFAESRDKKLQAQKKREAKDADQYLAWRGGLAQQRKAEERVKAMEEEAAKPFARYEQEGEVDARQREVLRWGDPMAHLVKKQGGDGGAAPVTHGLSSDALEKSGFIVPQEIPPHSWIKRGKAPPENRYGIRPGRHWDGVDRSNGFESKLFKHKNQRNAQEDEAYAWATADM